MSAALSLQERPQAAADAGVPLLELRGVSRMFGALRALTDITLTVRPGFTRHMIQSGALAEAVSDVTAVVANATGMAATATVAAAAVVRERFIRPPPKGCIASPGDAWPKPPVIRDHGASVK